MSQYAFGSGVMWGTLAGTTNPTPSRFGGLQDISIDFTATVKPLFGQYTFPLTVGRGTVKVQGKAKFAQLQGRLMNDLFFQGTVTNSQPIVVDNEISTPGSTYTVANGPTLLVSELGVRYQATGIPLTRVASAPAVGQYSFVLATGVYTFNASDNALVMLVSYVTQPAPVAGQKIVVGNPLIGVAPVFTCVFKQQYTGPAGVSQQMAFQFNACTASKLAFATKLEDFTIPELDFDAFCDNSNTLCTISLAEVN